MLTISSAISAGQAQTYHKNEFMAKEQNYWNQKQTVEGEWQGKLAERFGLSGGIGAEEFVLRYGAVSSPLPIINLDPVWRLKTMYRPGGLAVSSSTRALASSSVASAACC